MQSSITTDWKCSLLIDKKLKGLKFEIDDNVWLKLNNGKKLVDAFISLFWCKFWMYTCVCCAGVNFTNISMQPFDQYSKTFAEN